MTWVQRTQAWPSANSARRLAFGQTESYSVQPCLPLAATIDPVGHSRVFFYWVRPACLMVGPDYTAPSCPTASLSYSTIYPNSRDLGTAHASWPSAKSARRLAFGQTESYSVQPRLPLAATIGPAGRSRIFFYWVWPASLMVGPDYTARSCPTATYWDPPTHPRKDQLMDNFFCSQKYF